MLDFVKHFSKNEPTYLRIILKADYGHIDPGVFAIYISVTNLPHWNLVIDARKI